VQQALDLREIPLKRHQHVGLLEGRAQIYEGG